MTTFTDAHGREWKLKLTVGLLGDVRRTSGVDLGRVLRDAQGLGEVLFAEPDTLVRVLWVMVAGQADKAGVSAESFGYSFDGEALERAAEALLGAVLDFSPRSKYGQTLRARLPEILAKIDSQIIESANRSITNSLGGNSQASPGSTHAN